MFCDIVLPARKGAGPKIGQQKAFLKRAIAIGLQTAKDIQASYSSQNIGWNNSNTRDTLKWASFCVTPRKFAL